MDSAYFEAILNDAKKNWDSKPTGTQESYEAYKEYKNAVKAYSDWALSTLSNETPKSPSSVTNNVTNQTSSQDSTIKDFENKLLEQAKIEAASSPASSKTQEIAQETNTENWPSIKDKQEPAIINPKTGWPSQPRVPALFRGRPTGRYPMAKVNPFTRQPIASAQPADRSETTTPPPPDTAGRSRPTSVVNPFITRLNAAKASQLARATQTQPRTTLKKSFFG